MDALIEVLSATVGTLGFAIVFNIRGKKIFFAAFGGLLSWVLYLTLGLVLEDETLRYLIVSVTISVYAEILARLLKTPTTVFSIISLIPLIPGSSLYYTMTGAFSGDGASFMTNGIQTLKLAAALSVGIVFVSTTAVYVKKHLHQKKIS